MKEKSYLEWLAGDTDLSWWCDSGDPAELDAALRLGAAGVTTNPVLSYRAIAANTEKWQKAIARACKQDDPGIKAEELVRLVVTEAAQKLLPVYEASEGENGYVCAQVNPALASDTEAMTAMAERFHAWAPNIAVKLPVTAAGLRALEACTAESITVTATVSFTVPQVAAAAEYHRRGIEKACKAGRTPGKCFAVIMIGRTDDYLRDCCRDSGLEVTETDIRQAGLAVTKKAFQLFKKQGYEAKLLVAAHRGKHHMTELVGADFIVSIHPRHQKLFLSGEMPRDLRIEDVVEKEVLARLLTSSEFRKAYDEEGMVPEEFISYGATQRTLSQFSESGWLLLEKFAPKH